MIKNNLFSSLESKFEDLKKEVNYNNRKSLIKKNYYEDSFKGKISKETFKEYYFEGVNNSLIIFNFNFNKIDSKITIKIILNNSEIYNQKANDIKLNFQLCAIANEHNKLKIEFINSLNTDISFDFKFWGKFKINEFILPKVFEKDQKINVMQSYENGFKLNVYENYENFIENKILNSVNFNKIFDCKILNIVDNSLNKNIVVLSENSNGGVSILSEIDGYLDHSIINEKVDCACLLPIKNQSFLYAVGVNSNNKFKIYLITKDYKIFKVLNVLSLNNKAIKQIYSINLEVNLKFQTFLWYKDNLNNFYISLIDFNNISNEIILNFILIGNGENFNLNIYNNMIIGYLQNNINNVIEYTFKILNNNSKFYIQKKSKKIIKNINMIYIINKNKIAYKNGRFYLYE